MRIAIFHDHFRAIGGGEKLVLILARHLHADVITTDVDRSLIEKMGFQDVNVISLGTLARSSFFKLIHGPLKFYFCDFTGKYDYFIFSGNFAHFASHRHRPNLLYCHTPVRIYYDLREKTIASRKNVISRAIIATGIGVLSYFDNRSIAKVEKIATNSRNTAGRIKKYLSRDSVVVYPPCDTNRFHYSEDEGYWLSVNRLYPEKRVEVQIDAFRRMPDKKLLVIGDCGRGDVAEGYADQIKKNLPPNVSIISNVSENDLIEYYARCRGFITTALDEDFGMTVVEAMASGKPVIAVKEGGYLESVVDGETGTFIDCNPGSIVKAVESISGSAPLFREACLRQSKKFDVAIFLKEMDGLIGVDHPDHTGVPAENPVDVNKVAGGEMAVNNAANAGEYEKPATVGHEG